MKLVQGAASPLVCLLVAFAVPAAAQQASSDPVIVNFREYRAALERNDLPAAERAAAAALAASEAANGRRTAVLALNLATVRLELAGDHDALEPARTAHELATASADSGVDARIATLTLGRAELASGEERAGSRRLIAAIPEAEGDAAIAADVYNAAAALAQWALEAREFDTAENAWATAERLADTTADPTFARARALTGRGVAIFLRSANPREVQTGTRMTRDSTPEAQAAADAFASAQSLLMPAAYAEIPPGARLTAGQAAYAQAMAWQGALLARQETLNESAPVALPTLQSIPVYDARGLCRMRAFNAGPELQYPTEALFRYGVGAVVMHFALQPDGAVRSRTIAASVPPGPLAEAVGATLDNWRIEKASGSSPDCRAPPSLYYVIRFVLQ
jgi:hypothetical protein